MDVLDILQTVNVLGAIVLLLLSSQWLKKHLKQYAG